MKFLGCITFLFLVLVSVRIAEACSCAQQIGPLERQVAEAKKNYKAIFVGKLTKLEEPKTEDGRPTSLVIAHFEVERIWQGGTKSEITVYTTNVCCVCGFIFSEGSRYIVYAHGSDKLFVSSCSRTTPIEKKTDDEKYLGSPVIFEKKKTTLEPNS